MRAAHLPYNTDPASPSGIVLPGSMIDTARERDAMRRGLVKGIESDDCPVTDEQLIACVCSLGMPHFAAAQVRHSPMLRAQFYGTYALVQGAARGDKEAAERVDVIREALKIGREVGTVADKPDMSVGIWER